MRPEWRPAIRVFRMDTPPRGELQEDARESVILSCPGRHTITGALVAFADAVELHVSVDGRLRRVLRFLTDTAARKHLDRLSRRLQARGYQLSS
jgi:hypothetical protein